MVLVRQSTARTIPMGPFVDATDGVTPETALSLTQAETRLSKNGGAYAQKTDATTASHMEEGNYGIVFDATDTNTLGHLKISIYVAGALPVWLDCMVMPANVWDSLFGADALQVDLIQINGAAQTATLDNIEAQTDDIGVAGAGLTAVPWNAAWDAEVESEVDDALGAGTGTALTAIPWNAAWDAEVQSEVADALDVAIPGVPTADSINQRIRSMDLLTEASGAGDLAAILVDTGTTLQAELDGIQSDTEDIQTRLPAALVAGRMDSSLGAAAANTLTASALAADAVAEIADAIWDEAQADHVAVGSFGITASEIADVLVDTAVIGAAGAGLTAVPWNASWDAEVQSEVDDALVAQNLDHLVGTAVAIPAIVAGTYIDQIMDDGTAVFDRTTDSLQAVRDNMGTAQTGDSFARLGAPAGASIAADLVAIEAQTDDIGAAGAGLTAIPWNAAWDTEVQSECADALEATIADSVPADGTAPSVKQALYMLTQFMLERSVSGTTVTVRKPDGSTTLLTLTLSDATTPTSITRAT